MRRWHITAKRASSLDDLRSAIAAHGGTVADEPPVPLGDDEQVVDAEGPDDLPDRLRAHPAVVKVSPDSPKHPYS